MRSVGKGEAAAKVFCGVMNLPPPPKRFYESLHALNNATEKVAKVSMALAAAETLSFNNAYKAVLESKPYKDVNIEKLECVGHVEKRMGTRLRALKIKIKRQKLEDKKSLGGRNRLTEEIDKLQRYYDLNPQHGLCPLGDDSWCGDNRSKLKALQEADHARIRKAEKAISRRTKEARIKNRQLKCRQEDDLADDLSNPSYGSGMY
ncbi:uncharacterized protein TNCV_1942991 [Trichonephila clavipes]|nr:uncharacterized protein TNCV_1942991 [Trichonephila clavipes]